MNFVEGGNGRCTAEFKVKAEHLNKLGGLHGGFSSTLGEFFGENFLQLFLDFKMRTKKILKI